MKRILFAVIATLTLPAAAQRLAVDPTLPTYGTPVAIAVEGSAYPMYLPATRYTRSGSTITIDYEYVPDTFGPFGPGFGSSTVSLGELAAGNYTVQARLYDISNPLSAPTVISTNLPVMPPAEWGIYSVPREPNAQSATQALIRSAAYFDPASMRATVSGNVVRVEFTYKGDAPATGATPAGMTTFASVDLPPLAPGVYEFEGWGKSEGDPAYERFFSKTVQVASAVQVVEYYSASLDHYFISAGPAEIASVDRGMAGDWKRTGLGFVAWSSAADAPPGAVPVCRFYARGPNSHFYTGSRKECDELKALEISQRAEAQAKGQPFLGWSYETIAFWALLPQGGQCAGSLKPVWRTYNNRALENDSNHRFTMDAAQRAAMATGWLDEGAQLCASD
jgi:hypothetical protein